jgi:hypothetical protein
VGVTVVPQDRPTITTYSGWRAATKSSSFDPNVDNFYNKAVFPTQLTYVFGNSTRYNPLLRTFPGFNEDVSLGKAFHLTESKHLDFRMEACNLFNDGIPKSGFEPKQ